MISVLTTPNRPDYLRDTLQSLDDAGAVTLADKTIFVDGYLSEAVRKNVLPGWQMRQLHTGIGAQGTRPSLWRILNIAARKAPPFLLHFEDDIRLCKNAIHAMLAIDVPAWLGFVSFFQQNKGMSDAPGFHAIPNGQNWWGAQALKIPALSLLYFRDEKSAPRATAGGMQCDVWLGSRLRGGVLLPSLVRHVGLKTTIPGQENETLSGESIHRAGLHYVGDIFDALTHPFCPATSVRTSVEARATRVGDLWEDDG
jgi:hypothetical protein